MISDSKLYEQKQCNFRPSKNKKAASDQLPTEWEMSFFAQLGEDLVKKRRALKKTIEEVSTKLKIRQEYLHAIEKGDISVLPGAFYTKSFIKAYCEYCGLKIDGQYLFINEILKKIDRQQEIKLIKPQVIDTRPRKRELALAFFLIMMGYGIWAYSANIETQQNTSFPTISQVSGNS